MILMSHPEHGFTHVYDSKDQQEREKKGWTVVIESDEVAEPVKKRGRPRKEVS